MLTKEHAVAEYDRNKIIPDRLMQKLHGHYLQYAELMLDVYRQGIGKTRQELHRCVRKIFQNEPDCPYRRIDAFCKLLDDVGVYYRDIKGKAANLRKKVFRLAGPYHPLVSSVDRFFEHDEKEIKDIIAAKLKKEWQKIDRDLFADVPENHRLKEFQGYPDGRSLLSRYNVAQVQVALYRAAEMTVWASRDLKTILRYAKLARLMHTINHEGQGHYRLYFDGPASLLRETRRYGVNLAKFLPALVACRDWRLHARILTKWRRGWVSLQLSSRDGLKSHLPAPGEFDSSVEENFALKWGEEKRNGWTLEREGELLHYGQKVFFPDFVLRHENGRRVYLEIIGYWTPEYLQAKLETLELFKDYDILVAIAGSVAGDIPELPAVVIRFKSVLHLKDVLDVLDRFDQKKKEERKS
jgi:predicted nuclease of restriction endonuclease-like RecB superfamily